MTSSSDLVICWDHLTSSIDLCLQSIPAVPGGDAARQNTLDGALIEAGKYCGVQSTNLQTSSAGAEGSARCFYDDVHVM